jgi:GAF domain-containing protein
VGVIEVINKLDGTPFDEDDLFLLSSIAETAASALNNAGLLQAERKVEILETLVKVSAEITSTLDLDRVLDAIVTGPGAVIPYERAAIALEDRGRLKVRAITGMPRINPQDPNVVRLQELLEWASLSNDEVSFSQQGEQFEDPRPETQAKLGKYFSESGMRGFYAIPLADDDGRVGTLSFESSDPDIAGDGCVTKCFALSGSPIHRPAEASAGQEAQVHGAGEAASSTAARGRSRRDIVPADFPVAAARRR